MDEEKRLIMYICFLYITMTGLNIWNDVSRKVPSELNLKNKTSIERFLIFFSYEGEWDSGERYENIFSHKSGRVEMVLDYQINIFNDQQNLMMILNMKFFDPRFADDPLIKVKQHLQLVNTENSIILENYKNDNSLINNFYIFKNSQIVKKTTCNLSIKMTLNKNAIKKNTLLTGDFLANRNIIDFDIKTVDSDEICDLEVKGKIRTVPIFEKTLKEVIYSIFIISVIVMSFYGALKTMKKLSNDILYVKKISLITIELVCCQDSFILFFNLQLGSLIQNTFNFFFIFFFYFLLFCFIDQKILSCVWQNKIMFENPNLTQLEIQKKSYCYQFKIIVMIFFYNYFMFNQLLHPVLVILNSLILLPQICYNIRYRNISFFDKNFFVFYSSSSYVFFFYFRGIANNVINFKPFVKESLLGLGIILASLFFLKMQEIYGSAFLIPRFLRKNYNYFLTLKKYKYKMNFAASQKEAQKQLDTTDAKLIDVIDTTTSSTTGNSMMSPENSLNIETCAICLEELENNTNEYFIKNPFFRKISENVKKDVVMCPPCNHAFHPGCLLQWMEIKMECPYCKINLPPLD